jgi:hypothetical protein
MNPVEQLFFEEPDEPPRQRLERLTQAMMGLAEVFEPALSHYRAPGLYGRRIYVPAGTCVATRVHKQAHFTVALAGRCLVVDQDGNRAEIEAPAVFVTEPGTQRACLALTDVQWLTVHACEPTADASEMTEILTFKTFADYERWALLPAGEPA